MRVRCKAYIVDPDEDVRRSLAMVLKTYSIDAESFANGSDFQDRIETLTRGCVVLDLSMLDDCFGTLRRLQTYHHRLRTVVITGGAVEGQEELASSLGASAYFEKPFHIDLLVKAIVAACDSVSVH
jgi:FixJ family two-component response regulator